MGQFTVAADRIKFEGQAGGGTTADVLLASELKGTSYGAAYAINKELSIGAYIAKAESDKAGTVDEKTKAVAIGYNLGPVTIQAQYRDIENNSGAETLDGKIGGVKISTKF
jgi:predicted porin